MKKTSTNAGAFYKKSLVLILTVLSLSFSQFLFAHQVNSYTSTCNSSGSSYSIDASVSNVNSTSNYAWQYKNASNVWVCILNGNNTINGNVYSVSGATSTATTNPAPIVFNNPNGGLHGLVIRCVISDGTGVNPCNMPSGNTWNSNSSSVNHTINVNGTPCGTTTLSLGNRVWYDTNNNGMNDSEDGIRNVTVYLYRDNNNDNVADGASIATDITDVDGYYLFTNLTAGNYIVGVVKPAGYMSSAVNGGDPDNNINLDDNGQVVAGNEVRGLGITLTAGAEPTGGGNENITYDFGFLPDCACTNSASNLLTNESFESGTTGWSWSSANGNLTTGNSYVACGTKNGFNNQTSGTSKVWQDVSMSAGSTVFFSAFAGTHAPGISCSPKLSLIFLNSSNAVISQTDVTVTRVVGDYHDQLAYYSITAVAPANTAKARVQSSITCNTMKLDAFCLTATPPCNVNAGTDGSTSVCDNSTTAINLYSIITGEQTGGTWSRVSGTGGTFVASSGTFTPATGATTSVFRYVVTGTAPCSNDTSLATVNITAKPNAGTDGSTSVCDNSTTAINLYGIITGEQTGGTWSRVSGTGGTFVASSGTFTPATGATTSVFRYVVTGTAPCSNDTSVATVNIIAKPNAGTDGSTSVCDNSTTAINLYSIITGEQTGGTWSRVSGTGGTFVASSGTFTPAAGATTSVFRYVVTGTAPCGNDESFATVNITAAPNAGTNGSVSVCDTLVTAVNLYSIITGEQSGGTWTRLTGTGGTFNASAGTFTPAIGATNSTFQYSVGGSPCTPATSVATVIILNCQLLKLGNRVWYDTNNNGVNESSEAGIRNVTVRLYADANNDNVADGAATATTTTDVNGNYLFINLTNGNYIVGVVIPGGYMSSAVNGGDPDNNTDLDDNGQVLVGNEIRGLAITLASGTEPNGSTNNTYDFGLLPDCACTNSTGNLLTNASFENGTTGWSWSAANGSLTTGTGYVACGIKNGFNNQSSGTSSVWQDVNVSAGATVSFSAFAGTHAPGINCSPKLSLIFLNSSNGIISQIDVAVTRIVGDYNDQLEQYAITAVAPANTVKVRVQSSITCNTMKLDAFCLTATIPANLNLGNFVWHDANNNGVQDAAEPGINGATVKIYADANVDNVPDGAALATTTTNATGIYAFGSLVAGNYIVGVTLPTGYAGAATTATSASPDNDNLTDNNGITTVSGELRSNFITLSAGGEPTTDGDPNNGNLTLDFGLKGTGSLGDYVWEDLNRNGVQDANEPVIAGATVTLTYPNSTTSSTTTNASGLYSFTDLVPGTYSLTFPVPGVYVRTAADAGTNDLIDSDPDPTGVVSNIVVAGQVNNTIDAGFFKLIDLSGNVWNDANGMDDSLVNKTNFVIPIPVGLRVYLVNFSNGGIIEAIRGISSATGTFVFQNINVNTNYRLYLTNQAFVVGTVFPSTGFNTLPGTWRNTGEHVGLSPGSDGIANGWLNVPVGVTSVDNANFGIREGGGGGQQ